MRTYFMPFLYFKIACAIAFVLLHAYVYKGGDTYLYFAGGKIISSQILEEPERFFELLFSGQETFLRINYSPGVMNIVGAFSDSSTLAMSQLSAPFILLGFQKFLASTLLMSMVSFLGVWSLFKTLCSLYPRGTKLFALGVLFYPSIGIWGSGILKDTITLACIGWAFSFIYKIIQQKRLRTSIFVIAFSVFLCFKLKPYILYTFLPSMLLWSQGLISKNLKSSLVRYLATPVIILAFSLGGYFFLQGISSNTSKYSISNIQEVAEGFNSWHTFLAENRNQSGYSLGEIEFTPLGVLQKAPEAFFVTFYRPSLFEIRNFATAFESFQSTLLLLLTVYLIFKVGLINLFKQIFFNNNVRAFLVFAILLGIAVGLTSFNFGALSRYKIPCLPFYTAALTIIYFEGMKLRGNLR